MVFVNPFSGCRTASHVWDDVALPILLKARVKVTVVETHKAVRACGGRSHELGVRDGAFGWMASGHCMLGRAAGHLVFGWMASGHYMLGRAAGHLVFALPLFLPTWRLPAHGMPGGHPCCVVNMC